jgi:tetratricopeptide (TPR) repeat protein
MPLSTGEDPMRRVSPLILVILCLALATSCARKLPPRMEPTAQETFDAGLRDYSQEGFAPAMGKFERAVAMSPSFVEANYYLGLCAWKLNMLDHARKAFIDTLNLNPNHIQARESLGILSYNLSDLAEAKRNLEAARLLNSINPQVYQCLGRIYALEGRCPEALEVYQKGMQADSSYQPLRTEYENAKRTCGKSAPTASGARHWKKPRGGKAGKPVTS